MVSNIESYNFQLNEINFCRTWTDEIIINNNIKILYNPIFDDDYFFSRIIINKNKIELDMTYLSILLEYVRKNNMRSYVHCIANSVTDKVLNENNFKVIDRISGLKLIKKDYYIDKRNIENFSIEKFDDKNKIHLWKDIFCYAFNTKKYSNQIEKILIKNRKKFEFLIINKLEDKLNKSIGCGLLFEDSNCIGLYCLGVLPNYQSQGAGSNLIQKCLKIANEKGYKELICQTLESDNYLDFYKKNGFKVIYKKNIFEIR